MFIEIEAAHFSKIIFVSISVLIIFGHNLWLVAKDETDKIKIEVVTSDKFPESDSAVKSARIADFRFFMENGSSTITDYKTEKNSLVASLKKDEKAKLVALELFPHPIVLEAEKFAGYIKSEAAENFVEGETTKAKRESYAKFAKVLVENNSFDKIVGQKFEIVLQSNPSELKRSEKLKVKILFDGKPFENLRVSVGAENLNGGKYLAHSQTDENGLAELNFFGDGLWFVRTHFIRPHSDSANFDWESFWASVTFRI